MHLDAPLGATCSAEGVQFRIWAPRFHALTLLVSNESLPVRPYGGAPEDQRQQTQPGVSWRRFEAKAEGDGFFSHFVPDAAPGMLYAYEADGSLFPDPASRFQPFGVHGPSQVVDAARFLWHDEAWKGLPLKDVVFYELHVGTFTPEGTLQAAAEKLPYLRDLGVTAVEIMPVADFPGRWNWGYDQASLWAPSRAYGSPDDLRRFIEEAHRIGLAVYLDVIYNHFGPDGAYAAAFGNFFSEKHKNPWGAAINLDGDGAEGVRTFFIQNARHWLTEYHADGLRLDATHVLIDDSPQHFLAELSEAVSSLDGPPRLLVAEDERNLNTLLVPREKGGYGLNAVWADDFHHQVRNLIAGDEHGYYADFAQTTAADLKKTLENGWFFTGQKSKLLGHERGTKPKGADLNRFVICIQNHDQVGNRAQGNRLTSDTSEAAYRAASALFLFAAQTPLLFQGQEWGTQTPFQFFTDHNPELGRLVSEGRRKEFEAFASFSGTVPDPQDPDTFRRSELDWTERRKPEHSATLALYSRLLALRKSLPEGIEVEASGNAGLSLRRGEYLMLLALREGETVPVPTRAEKVFHTEEEPFATNGTAPIFDSGSVHFMVPAAVIMRLLS